jgi:serine protease Do
MKMKYLLRPNLNIYRKLGISALCAAAVFTAAAPRLVHAQAQEIAPIFEEPSPLAIHSSPAGYLGVDFVDVDNDKAQTLRLKDTHGAVITLIDHDAPAGQVGLKVNDVILAINGQAVEGAESLRRMLRGIPPGNKISLEISRDGNIQTLAVQLVNRKVMEHDIWSKIGIEGATIDPVPPMPTMGLMGGGGDAPPPGGFHLSLFTSTLNVGAMIEPLTSQMAEYLGVQSGLMVKQVARKSEAAAAGLKAFDVILKVGSDSIATSADWDRALRSNQGKPVQVTILRDKKQQTLTLQVDSKHRGALEYDDPFDSDDGALLAELTPVFDEGMAPAFSAQTAANANALAGAAQAQTDASGKGLDGFQISQGQIEQLRRQVEALEEGMKNFKIDPDQMKALQKQAESLCESMKDFQIDPKQMEQIRHQMEEFRKNFDPEQMKGFERQMKKFNSHPEDWEKPSCAHCV